MFWNKLRPEQDHCGVIFIKKITDIRFQGSDWQYISIGDSYLKFDVIFVAVQNIT